MPQEPTGAEVLHTLQHLRALDKRVAAEHGFNIEEMHCLLQIHIARPDSIKDLRALLNLKPSHVSKLLRGLEDRSLLLREIDPKDQRKGRIRLTPAGMEKAEAVSRVLNAERAAQGPPEPPQAGFALPDPPGGVIGSLWQPRIVAFFCTWCTYTAADLAGVSRMKYDPEVRIIRLMCSGRVDPQFILEAFNKGADGVLVGGCHPGDCHYLEGNINALRRLRLLSRVLEAAGVDPRRLRLEWISAAEGEKVQRVIREMTASVRELGPISGRNKGTGVVLAESEVAHV